MLRTGLTGARLLQSQASGKQMLFRFSGGLWLGLHLGMTGQLRLEPAGLNPDRHDHLFLRQRRQDLVFADPRQFGRVRVHHGPQTPVWWSDLAPALTGTKNTLDRVRLFLGRHGRLPIKAALLLQGGFPGIGNWMADEVLWQSCIHPRTGCFTSVGPGTVFARGTVCG